MDKLYFLGSIEHLNPDRIKDLARLDISYIGIGLYQMQISVIKETQVHNCTQNIGTLHIYYLVSVRCAFVDKSEEKFKAV